LFVYTWLTVARLRAVERGEVRYEKKERKAPSCSAARSRSRSRRITHNLANQFELPARIFCASWSLLMALGRVTTSISWPPGCSSRAASFSLVQTLTDNVPCAASLRDQFSRRGGGLRRTFCWPSRVSGDRLPAGVRIGNHVDSSCPSSLFVQVVLTSCWGSGRQSCTSARSAGEARPREDALRRPIGRKVLQVVYAFQNQIELPLLFYVLTILAWNARHADLSSCCLPGSFVVLRLMHAYVTSPAPPPVARLSFIAGARILRARMTGRARLRISRRRRD
jgi:hypothetical protein